MNKNACNQKRSIWFFTLFFMLFLCCIRISDAANQGVFQRELTQRFCSESVSEEIRLQENQNVVNAAIATVCYIQNWYQNITSNRFSKEGSRQSIVAYYLVFCGIFSLLPSVVLLKFFNVSNYFISKLNEILIVIHKADGKKKIFRYNI